MAAPKIYYAASSDYLAVVVSTLSFPYTQDYPSIAAQQKFDTVASRALDGSVRSVQVHDGRGRFVLSFRLFSDVFLSQFRAFVNTVRGTRFPFIYVDTDGILYFLRCVADPVTRVIRFDLNEIVSMELEGTAATGTVGSGRGDLTAELDPEGRITTDPDGNTQLVWS